MQIRRPRVINSLFFHQLNLLVFILFIILKEFSKKQVHFSLFISI